MPKPDTPVVKIGTKLHVRYLTDDELPHEVYTYAVEDENPEREARNAPSNAYAFFYLVRLDIGISVNHTDQDVLTSSDDFSTSARFYIDGQVLTHDEVRELPGNHKNILARMESGDFGFVVLTCTDRLMPFAFGRDEVVTTM